MLTSSNKDVAGAESPTRAHRALANSGNPPSVLHHSKSDSLTRSSLQEHDFKCALSGWVRYRVLKQIGSGSFGTVFLALDSEPSSPHYQEYVAVKAVPLAPLSQAEVDLAMEEVALLRTLAVHGHPNVIKLLDNFIDDEFQLCSVTEYINGGDLAGLIRKHRRTWAGDYGLRGVGVRGTVHPPASASPSKQKRGPSRLPKARQAKGSAAQADDVLHDDAEETAGDRGSVFEVGNSNGGADFGDGSCWGDSRPLFGEGGAQTTSALLTTNASITDSQLLDLQKENPSLRDGYLDSFVVADIARQLLEGLAFIHSYSIIHRDIKPGNVFITLDGVVKIGDLGVGKLVSDSSPFANTFIGTPHYVCPELCLGEQYSFAADVWSLGVLLYELFTLEIPFQSSNVLALMDVVSTGDYDVELLNNRRYSEAQRERFRQQMGDERAATYIEQSEGGLSMLVASLVSSMLVVDSDERPTAMQLRQMFFGDDEGFSSSRPVSAGPLPPPAGTSPAKDVSRPSTACSEMRPLSPSPAARSALLCSLRSAGMLPYTTTTPDKQDSDATPPPALNGEELFRSIGVRDSFSFLLGSHQASLGGSPALSPPSPVAFTPTGSHEPSPSAVDPRRGTNGIEPTAETTTSARDDQRDAMLNMIEKTLAVLGGDVALYPYHLDEDDDDTVLMDNTTKAATNRDGTTDHPKVPSSDPSSHYRRVHPVQLRSSLHSDLTDTLRRYVRGDASANTHRDPSTAAALDDLATPLIGPTEPCAIKSETGTEETTPLAATTASDGSATYEATLRLVQQGGSTVGRGTSPTRATSAPPAGSASRVVDTLRSWRASEFQDALKGATRSKEGHKGTTAEGGGGDSHCTPQRQPHGKGRRISWTRNVVVDDGVVEEQVTDAQADVGSDGDGGPLWNEEYEAKLQDHVDHCAPWGNRNAGHSVHTPRLGVGVDASPVKCEEESVPSTRQSVGSFDATTPIQRRFSGGAILSQPRTEVGGGATSNAAALANLRLRDLEDHIIMFHGGGGGRVEDNSFANNNHPTVTSVISLRRGHCVGQQPASEGGSTLRSQNSTSRSGCGHPQQQPPDLNRFQRQLAEHIRGSFARCAANEDLRKRESLDRPATAGLRGLGFHAGSNGRLGGTPHPPGSNERSPDNASRPSTSRDRPAQRGFMVGLPATPDQPVSNRAPRRLSGALHGRAGDVQSPRAKRAVVAAPNSMDPTQRFNDPASLEQRLRSKAIEYHRRRLLADSKRRKAIADANRKYMFHFSANPAMAVNSYTANAPAPLPPFTAKTQLPHASPRPFPLYQSEASRLRQAVVAVQVQDDVDGSPTTDQDPRLRGTTAATGGGGGHNNYSTATLAFTNDDDVMFAETCKKAFAESAGLRVAPFQGRTVTFDGSLMSGATVAMLDGTSLGSEALSFLQTHSRVLNEARAIGATFVENERKAEEELRAAEQKKRERIEGGASLRPKNTVSGAQNLKDVCEEIQDEMADPKLFLHLVCTGSKQSFRIKGLRSSSDPHRLLHKITKTLTTEAPDILASIKRETKGTTHLRKNPGAVRQRKQARFGGTQADDVDDNLERLSQSNIDLPALVALGLVYIDAEGDSVSIGSPAEWEYAVRDHVRSEKSEYAGMVLTSLL